MLRVLPQDCNLLQRNIVVRQVAQFWCPHYFTFTKGESASSSSSLTRLFFARTYYLGTWNSLIETCNSVPSVICDPVLLHSMPETSPNSTGLRHFSQTRPLVLSQDFSARPKPGGHGRHFLHTTFDVAVHGRNSNSFSLQREQGRHAVLREAWDENVPSSHGMQRVGPFWRQNDEYPGGHFLLRHMGDKWCGSVLPSG